MPTPADTWPTPVANVTAAALDEILATLDGLTLGNLEAGLASIRLAAGKAAVFNPETMRLRFDDNHGNRSFVQRVDGVWKAFRPDGQEVRLAYCFGPTVEDAAVLADLFLPHTIGSVQKAAIAHATRLVDVQVEATWERHSYADGRFRHVTPPGRAPA